MMRRDYLFTFIIALIAFVCLTTGDAMAQMTCTSLNGMQPEVSSGEGIVTSVMRTIIAILSQTSEFMYNSIIDDAEFKAARNAALLILISIYGVMVTFNIINLRPGEIVSLVFKIGLIMGITESWEFFDEFIGRFFFGTMLELIEVFMGRAQNVTTSGYDGPGSITGQVPERLTAPLQVLNWPMAQIFSTQFMITIIAVFPMWPLGPFMAIFLLFGAWFVIWTLIGAIFTYIKAIVSLWFLFALAPIFFLFLLFRRTQQLWEGWLNLVVSSTIEPILLFSFLAFFLTLVSSSLDALLTINWCWTEVRGASGGWFDLTWWRPMRIGDTVLENGLWSLWGFVGSDQYGRALDIKSPLSTIDVLFFMLSAYVAAQYTRLVNSLSSELSQGGLRLTVNAQQAREYFKSKGMALDGGISKGARSFWGQT